ncbi:MAG: fumarylacetoacetate hydrolase family protein [Christensenellales bacterium]|jgi:2-keto-4-pentenoate hydratase/2-oxohepta-3-ene-1,7-dioic acid hydratase in catechol pathway
MLYLRARRDNEAFYAELAEGRIKRLAGSPYEGAVYTGEEYDPAEVKLLPPSEPTKIVAVGLNYAKHAAELKEKLVSNPVLFIKPPTSLITHGEAIVWPAASQRVDYEAELAVVIGKKCKAVTPEEAPNYIFGYTALNDVTARDIQKADGQWTRAKSFDTFCPVGPYIDTAYNPAGRRVQSVVDGIVRQEGNTDDMLFRPAELVSFISECMTLLPGDIIATGTPEGVGPLRRGGVVEIRIDGLETLRNSVE